MDFICLTFDEAKRWVRIDQIAAMEEEGSQTIIYLVNNSQVHIACDQEIGEVMRLVMDSQEDLDELRNSI